MLPIALLCALARAATVTDTGSAPSTDTDTDVPVIDTGVPVPVVWSEGDGAAEISREAGGHSWEGCAHAPAASWAWPAVLLLARRRR